MITEIFIPEKIGPYYVLPKRIMGFDVTKTHVYASQIYFSGNNIILEKFYQEQIDPDMTRSYPERVSEVIRAIITQTPTCNEIRSSLSSSMIVFKELTVPFIDPEKISMILYYEIEQYLPFALQDTIADFIITKQNLEEKTSTILVAACQKEYVAQHIAYFDLAGLNPSVITVDLFDLYGLYREIPEYTSLHENVALIDIEFNVTRIAFIINGQLKFIRTLPRGIVHVAKTIANNLSIGNGNALEDLIRFGLEKHDDPHYNALATQAMQTYLKDVQFTLQAFTTQTKKSTIDHILLLGRGSEIHNIDQFVTNDLGIASSFFDGNALLKIPNITIKNSSRIPRANIMSLATAFPSTVTERFNMRQREFALSTTKTFYQQFFTAIGLIIVILALIFAHSYWQTSSLATTARTMERSVVTRLNELDLTDAREFNKAVEEAEEKVTKEEELWFGFSRQTRFSFLKALQDLSTAIDRKGIGLNLKKLVITTNDITFEGEVKGFEELKALEQALRDSKLFVYVPTLQELKFSEKLPLRKNGESNQ